MLWRSWSWHKDADEQSLARGQRAEEEVVCIAPKWSCCLWAAHLDEPAMEVLDNHAHVHPRWRVWTLEQRFPLAPNFGVNLRGKVHVHTSSVVKTSATFSLSMNTIEGYQPWKTLHEVSSPRVTAFEVSFVRRTWIIITQTSDLYVRDVYDATKQQNTVINQSIFYR